MARTTVDGFPPVVDFHAGGHNPPCQKEFAQVEAAWQAFMRTGEIDASVVRPIIADSWVRCRALGLDPNDTKCFHLADEKELQARIAANKQLIFTAWSFM